MGQLRSTFTTTAKLERTTGLPVLGAISETLTDIARAADKRRRKQFYMASGALGGIFVLLLVAEFIQVSMVA
jgi:predicted dinucleotide-utilizing enzyme